MSTLAINSSEYNGSSFRPRRDFDGACLVPVGCFLLLKARCSLRAPWNAGILTEDDGCCHSLNSGLLPKFVLWGCACPEWGMRWLGCFLSGKSPWPKPAWVWGWFSLKLGNVCRWAHSAGDASITCATGCMLMTYFSAPWVMAGVVKSIFCCIILPSLNLNPQIPSFLVSVFLCLKYNKVSCIGHSSSSQQQWWLLISGAAQEPRKGPWQHWLLCWQPCHRFPLTPPYPQTGGWCSLCVNRNPSGDYSCSRT